MSPATAARSASGVSASSASATARFTSRRRDADSSSRTTAAITGCAQRSGQGTDPEGQLEARAQVAAGAALRPGVTGEARVTVRRTNLLGALVWGVRKRVRSDLWL